MQTHIRLLEDSKIEWKTENPQGAFPALYVGLLLNIFKYFPKFYQNLAITSHLKKTLESANETKLKAEDLFKTGGLLTTIQGTSLKYENICGLISVESEYS